MESIALRPRKATEIVDAAIEVYRRNPVHFMLLTAMVHAPWLILQLLLIGNAPPTAKIGTQVLIGLGTAASNYFMTAVVVQMASDLYLGRDTDAFEAFRRVGWKLPTAFAASLIQAILLLIGLGPGLLLLGFPAVYWTALYFAAIPAIVLERKNLFEAFGRSSQLSKGLKLHVLSALGLVVIIRVMVGGGAAALLFLIPNNVAQRILSTLVSIIVYPIAGISYALIYYDARIRREGFDIEMMAGGAENVTIAAPVA